MSTFARMREIAEGIRLGIRFAILRGNDTAGFGVEPRIRKLNVEEFGR